MTESALMIKLIQYILPNNRYNNILMESNIFGNFGISINEDDIEKINSIESQFETTNNININLRAFQKNKN